MEREFALNMKTIHTSGCMVSKKIPFHSLCLFAIDIFSQIGVGDTMVRNLSHLKEVS
jgi:hypothetical protein